MIEAHRGAKRAGQALENIRAGQRRRREREQAAKAAAVQAESGES